VYCSKELKYYNTVSNDKNYKEKLYVNNNIFFKCSISVDLAEKVTSNKWRKNNGYFSLLRLPENTSILILRLF
jgi:hypothetical protein